MLNNPCCTRGPLVWILSPFKVKPSYGLEREDNTGMQEAAKEGQHNVGSQPSQDIRDSGKGAEAKQPKEHTGKDTGIGNSIGGNSGLGDASEGNDNTGGH